MNVFGKLSVFVGLFVTISAFSEQKESVESFLKSVRQPQLTEAWSLMSGKAEHYRAEIVKNDEVIQEEQAMTAPIRLGMRFQTDSINAQLVFNNTEIYAVGQQLTDGQAGTTVTRLSPVEDKDVLLPEFGLRPSDLTLSFVHWDFVKEEASERVSGLSCRVMILQNPASDEQVRLWLAERYRFPVKVQWLLKDKVQREARFSDFKEINGDLVMIKQFRIENKSGAFNENWQTRITFEEIEADRDLRQAPPANLFIQRPVE